MLINAPTGVSWNTIPGLNASGAEQVVQALNLCARATSTIDAYLELPLRATINTETVYGPGDERCQLRRDGTARLLLSRPPVVEVISGVMRLAAQFPKVGGNVIPANMMAPEKPVMSIYGSVSPGSVAEVGQAVIVAPGYLSYAGGRMGTEMVITYLNGYPHTQLTANVAAGAQDILVDDITGMVSQLTGAGAFCTLYSGDDAIQEAAVVASVTPATAGMIAGPGTLHLTAPLAYSHRAGDLFTTLPATVQQAAILMASSMALQRGATATVVQSFGGGANRGGAAGINSADLANEAEVLIHPYKRVW